MLKTLSGHRPSQKEKEITRFLELLKESNHQSYLEIGARHGDTFYDVVTKTLPKDGLAVAVDLPGGTWGVKSSEQALKNCVETLKSEGWTNVHAIFGDSQSRETVDKILEISSRYDSILIDGDHRYKGVKDDWITYKPLAKNIVAFHDIAGEGVRQKSNPRLVVEVPRLWREIKDRFKHEEIIDSVNEPQRPMGIGVLYL